MSVATACDSVDVECSRYTDGAECNSSVGSACFTASSCCCVIGNDDHGLFDVFESVLLAVYDPFESGATSFHILS